MRRGNGSVGERGWYCECYGAPYDPDEFAVDGAVGEAEVEEEDGEANEGGVPELDRKVLVTDLDDRWSGNPTHIEEISKEEIL